MPALMTPPKAEKFSAEVGTQLAQAAGKIRLHDITVGGLLLITGLLAYVAAMVMLDKWLDLDAWVRQLGWCGLVGVLGLIAYRFLLRPLRSAVNPLYAAKLVESTLPDAKNSVVNWVDLHETAMPESVRNAVSAKAAKHLAKADLNKAIETRLLVLSGSAVAGLVVVLAVLFLIFKPTVFFSLVGRSLNPFSHSAIASRTILTLTQPVGGDLTITAGQPVTIAVTVEGREPDMNAPDRLRAILRHNPANPNGEEVNLEPIGGGEWSVQVPQHLIQHGFLYRVVGSDAETPEFKVTVRPRPVFTHYEIKYEYPAYLNIAPETSRDPHIEAYRGTVVTITAKANRELKDGRMMIADVPQPIAGEVAGDTLKVRFTLMQNGSYRLFFTATTDEVNADSPPYLLRVISDAPPVVTFKPTQQESVTLPLNGLLTIDADATDDFGVDSITLKMRLANGKALPDRPYREGKSFRREKDNTWPTEVDYKDSIRLEQLKLQAGTVIEYWLEAKDNCTVPQANVGKSKVMKLLLGPPKNETDVKSEQENRAEARQKEEAAHRQSQDAKNSAEPRPRPNGPQEKKTKPEEKNVGNEAKKDAGEPGANDKQNPSNEKSSQSGKAADAGSKTGQKTKDAAGDSSIPRSGEQKKDPVKNEPQPGDEAVKKQADQVKDQLDKMKNDGGEVKPGGTQDQGEPKPSQKKDGASDPQNQPEAKNGEKNEGASEDKSSPKSDPNGQEKPSPGDGGAPPMNPGAGDAKNQSPPKTGQSKPVGKDPANDSTSETKDAGSPMPGDSTAESKATGQNSPENAGNAKPNPQDDNELSRENSGKANSKPSNKPLDHEQLFRNLQSKDAAKREKAEKQLEDELRKKKKQEQQQSGGDGGEKSPSGQDVSQAANDLKSGDGAKKQNAEKTLDKAMQNQAKADAEKMEQDLKSNNPQTKAAAEKQLDELKKKAQENPKGGGDAKDLAEAAKDLNSPDAAKRQAAEQKIDKAVGENARKQAQQLAKDLQSNDKGTREAAEKKVEELKKKADEMAKDQPKGNSGQQNPDSKEIGETAKDLNSPDPAKQQAAKEKLDQAAQQNARQEAEKLAKDLQSKDEATKAAAEKKLEAMKKQAEENAKNQKGGGDQKPVDSKDLAEAVKNLNSPDPAQKKAAEDKINQAAKENAQREAAQLAKDLQSKDAASKAAAEKKLDELKNQAAANEKAMAETARQEAEQLAKDLKSDNPATRAAAQKKLDDLKKSLEDMAKNQKPAPPSPEQMNKMKEMAKDLNSPDQSKREKAEKGLDDQIGRENRDKLQQAMKDEAKPGEPLPKDVQQKLEEMAKHGKPSDQPKPGGAPVDSNDTASKPLEANPEFAKRSGQLQLEPLKKEQVKKELMKKLGWTQEDYDRFLQGYEKMLNRQEAANSENKNPIKSAPVEKRDTSGGGKVETRADANTSSPQGNGSAFAPPGYSDAQKRFQDAARKSHDNK